MIHSGKISLIANATCISKECLFEIEDEYIQKFKNEGFNVINVKTNNKVISIKIPETKIVQDIHITKFAINDNEKEHRLRINYAQDGKYKQKDFRYKNCGKMKQ